MNRPAPAKTDPTIRIRVDGKTYSVDPGEVSRSFALECLQECGMSHEQAISSLFISPGKLSLSVFLWVARRQAGEPRFRRDGRVTVRLIDEIYNGLSGFDESVELVDDADEASTPPQP